MTQVLIAATTAPPTSLEAIRAKLTSLEHQLAMLPDVRDVLNTDRAQAHHRGLQQVLIRRASVLRNALAHLPALEADLAAVTTWITYLTTWREEFATRLAALQTLGPDLTREQHDEQLSLATSLKNIDEGTQAWNGRHAIGAALRQKITAHYQPTWSGGSDPWTYGFGSLVSAREQLNMVTAQRDEARHAVEAAMVEPEPLTS